MNNDGSFTSTIAVPIDNSQSLSIDQKYKARSCAKPLCVSESIGFIINILPLYVFSCTGFGCCLPFWGLYISSLMGIFSSVNGGACCKDLYHFLLMGCFSLISFLIRIVMFIFVCITVVYYQNSLKNYKKCCNNPPYDDDSIYECDYDRRGRDQNFLEDDDDYRMENKCAELELPHYSKAITKEVLGWSKVSLVILGIWMMISIVASFIGFKTSIEINKSTLPETTVVECMVDNNESVDDDTLPTAIEMSEQHNHNQDDNLVTIYV